MLQYLHMVVSNIITLIAAIPMLYSGSPHNALHSSSLKFEHVVNSKHKLIMIILCLRGSHCHPHTYYFGITVVLLSYFCSPVLAQQEGYFVPGGATEHIQLHCGASGSNYQWYIERPNRASEPIISCADCTEYQGAEMGILNINGVRARNEGVYQCKYTESSQTKSGPLRNVTVLGMWLNFNTV